MENKALKIIDSMIDEAFESCAMEQPEVANTVVVMISTVVNNFLDESGE